LGNKLSGRKGIKELRLVVEELVDSTLMVTTEGRLSLITLGRGGLESGEAVGSLTNCIVSAVELAEVLTGGLREKGIFRLINNTNSKSAIFQNNGSLGINENRFIVKFGKTISEGGDG
jgi:hypothetical protein